MLTRKNSGKPGVSVYGQSYRCCVYVMCRLVDFYLFLKKIVLLSFISLPLISQWPVLGRSCLVHLPDSPC